MLLKRRKKLFSLWRNLINKLYFFKISPRYVCQIKKIDLQAKKVIVFCYGMRIIIIKSSIAQLISDSNIIVNLPPQQACFLGYHYGKLYEQFSKKFSFDAHKGRFLLRFTVGRFKIVSFERNNTLNYLDVITNKIYKASPITIAQNKSIILQFDSSQACYIGILAGLIAAKKEEICLKGERKPLLTLVK